MPSRFNDTIANAVLNLMLGSGANTATLGATLYVDLLTTAPSDANGTSAVSWGQGRVAVTVADGTMWPAASARTKQNGSTITFATNASGSTINAVAFAFYTASSGGTYQGGGALSGSPVAVANGSTPSFAAGSLTITSPNS